MKLIILDRDGVINHDSDEHIRSPAEWYPIQGSLEAIARLKHAGFLVVVASNQSGLARGLFDYERLFAIHDRMQRALFELGVQLDGIFFCPHHPEAGCRCRKPAPGLLEDIGKRFGRSVKGSIMVGDAETDVRAARAAGAHPVLVRTGKAFDPNQFDAAEVTVCADLAQAADFAIERSVKPVAVR